MKIQFAAVDLSARYEQEQSKSVRESFNYWTGSGSREVMPPVSGVEDILELSASENPEAPGKTLITLSPKDRELIELIEKFVEQLTGKKIKLVIPDMAMIEDDRNIRVENTQQGWGFTYSYEETYFEKEAMVFKAEGRITAEDGREIEFHLQVAAAREFFSRTAIDIRGGDALVDPLVINYNGKLPELSEIKFAFDLDSDGKDEMISYLEGSGFLALDKNEDGKINNGSELFGPLSGDGFSDLAAYDSDQNGWIDENDPVFSRLRIWIKDTSGNDRLVALGEKGIGAIYLGNVSTIFSLKDNTNQTHGMIDKTGVFIKENGEAGTIQHVNLVI